MNFLNRLKYYLIGVSLGILMVLAIFKDRKLTSWTPQNQVTGEIEEKNILVPDSLNCLFDCAGYVGTEQIKTFLITGNVDFSASDVENHKKKLYHLNYSDSKVTNVQLLFLPDHIEVMSVELTSDDCKCL